MHSIYFDASRKRPVCSADKATTTIERTKLEYSRTKRTNLHALLEFGSFDWCPSSASHARIDRTRKRNFTRPVRRNVNEVVFLNDQLFYQYFLFTSTNWQFSFVFCLFLFCDFASWRCTVYFQSGRLFTVSYLAHIISYVQLIGVSWDRSMHCILLTEGRSFRCDSIGFYVSICYNLKAGDLHIAQIVSRSLTFYKLPFSLLIVFLVRID